MSRRAMVIGIGKEEEVEEEEKEETALNILGLNAAQMNDLLASLAKSGV